MPTLAARLSRLLAALARERKGATSVEYAFIIAMIFLAIVVSVRAVGNTTSEMWNNVSNKVDAAVQ